MKKRVRLWKFAVASLLCGLTTSFASADIVTTTGDVQVVAAPPSVRRNDFEHTSLARVFFERLSANFANLTVNAVLPGRYDAYADFQDQLIPSPGPFETYFLHFDPVGSVEGFVDGTVTFDRPMLGVIGRSLTMEQTDYTLGAPGTLYPTNRFDREPEYQPRGNYDYFELSADMRTMTFRLRATDIDQLRMVVSAVPEPGMGIVVWAVVGGIAFCRNRTGSPSS